MVNKILLSFILAIFLISSISAQDMRFTGEQNEIIDVTETCSFNDLPCPSTFSCNITIENPRQNVIVLNEPMTRNETIYNYSLTQTSELGIYEAKQVYCSDGNNNGTSSFFFRITSTGAEPIDTGKGLTILGTFIVLIVATLFFLVFAIFTKNVPFKIFFVGLSLLLMVSTVGFVASTMQQVLSTFDTIVSTMGNFYILLTILLTAGGIGLFVYLVVMALKSFDSTRNFFRVKDE